MRSTLPLALCVALATRALAQAPVVTPRGDPSVRSDTIYRLAVDSTAYPEEPYIVLFDDGIVRDEADGRGARTYRQVIQVLKQEAAEEFGELRFSYSRSRERLTVNWTRVVRPDGSVISDSATHVQESDAPAALSSPVYSDTRIVRVTLGGVAPGALVDWSYTVETLQPIMPGDFFTTWGVLNARPTRRSRLLVDVPASMTPRIHERNIRFARQETVSHGRRVYGWLASDVPKPLEYEPFAVDSDDVASSVAVSSPAHWTDVAVWYAGLARDRYEVTPPLDSALARVVHGQRAQDDSVRALYSWISQDFRYVSMSLGIAGYQPRRPAAVLETKYADCKDKATLFIALARRMGLTAYPVLVSSEGGVDSILPTPEQFDHMIVALERPGGYLYLDPTAEDVPVGLLPASESGTFALVVHPEGRGETVTLPRDSTSGEYSRLTGTLSADGRFDGHLTLSFEGTAQLGVRGMFGNDIPVSRRPQVARNMASAIFEGASGDSLELFDGRDLTAPARLAVAVHGGQAMTHSGGTDIMPLSFLGTQVSQQVIGDVAAHVPRHYHIGASQVFGTSRQFTDVRITLPEGWRARLPDSVSVAGAFGRYTSSYTQEGRDLVITRRVSGQRGILRPERVTDLLEFLRAVARDDAKFIVLDHP